MKNGDLPHERAIESEGEKILIVSEVIFFTTSPFALLDVILYEGFFLFSIPFPAEKHP